MQWLAIAAIVLSARVAASSCYSRSQVVGLRRCMYFGEWSPHLDRWNIWFDFGYLHHVYPSAPFAFDTSARLEGQHSLPTMPTVTNGSVVRALYGLRPWLYLGLEYGLGALGHVAARTGGTQIDVLNIEGLALGGARVYYYSRFALSAELAAGARDTQFSQDPGTAYVVQSRRELEARVRFDVFTDVKNTIGVGYGQSLIDAHDWSWTITFGLHSRVLDGYE